MQAAQLNCQEGKNCHLLISCKCGELGVEGNWVSGQPCKHHLILEDLELCSIQVFVGPLSADITLACQPRGQRFNLFFFTGWKGPSATSGQHTGFLFSFPLERNHWPALWKGGPSQHCSPSEINHVLEINFHWKEGVDEKLAGQANQAKEKMTTVDKCHCG